MAQINKPTDYFNTILWTGDGTSSRGITGVGFQPDLVWTKNRGDTINHSWVDVIRGTTKQIYSDVTNAEQTNATGLTAFDSDGFTVGSSNYYNTSSNNYVAWNWLAGGTASSNTDGSITSSVSANTTAGFSICTFTTSTGSSDTIGHGLGSVPSLIIARPYTSVSSWFVYHQSLGNGSYMRLNNTDAVASSAIWNNTTPTSSVFSLGLGAYGTSQTSIAYCFAEKKGFSKFGSYTGNGNADGTFVYTGFKPAFLIYKCSSTANDWLMKDNKREPNNEMVYRLKPNSNVVEDSLSGAKLDFVSNGFKIRESDAAINASGATFIYMAFAEQPLTGTNGIPCTAR